MIFLLYLSTSFVNQKCSSSRTSSRRSSTKKARATQNSIKENVLKGRYTLVHFLEKCKKLKIMPHEQKNIIFGKLLWKSSQIVFFWVLQFSQKGARLYRLFRHFSIAQTTINPYCFVFPKVEKLNISAVYKSIIIIYQWIFLWYLYTSFVKRKFNPNHQENLESIV